MIRGSYSKYAEIRDKAGLTDNSVAKSANILSMTLYGWKAGDYYPKIDKLQRIALVLKCSIEDLLEESGG